MCAASHSRYTFCSADDKKVNVDKKNVDVVLFLIGRTGRPAEVRPDAPERCAPRPIPATFRSVDDKKANVDEENVDFVLFFDGPA